MKEALKLALEMVQNKMYAHAEMYLKEALAQQSNEQVEPVAYIHRNEYNEYRLEPHDNFEIKSIPFNVDILLFAHPPVPTAQPDHKKYCTVCQGVGQVDTGIMESPVTVCNACNGTGLKDQPNQNLSCKSTQARLAASWGYVKAKPLTHEQRFDLLTKFESYKHEWHAPAILIDMVEAAHNIKETPCPPKTKNSSASSARPK